MPDIDEFAGVCSDYVGKYMQNNLNSIIHTLVSKGYNISSVFDIGANKGKWTAQYEKERDARAAEAKELSYCGLLKVFLSKYISVEGNDE